MQAHIHNDNTNKQSDKPMPASPAISHVASECQAGGNGTASKSNETNCGGSLDCSKGDPLGTNEPLIGHKFAEQHPRREQVISRINHAINAVNADYGDLGGHYLHLMNNAQNIISQEQHDAQHDGRITIAQEKHLDQEVARLDQSIKADDGHKPSGDFGKDHPRRAQVMKDLAEVSQSISDHFGHLGGRFDKLQGRVTQLEHQELKDAQARGGSISALEQEQLDAEARKLEKQVEADRHGATTSSEHNPQTGDVVSSKPESQQETTRSASTWNSLASGSVADLLRAGGDVIDAATHVVRAGADVVRAGVDVVETPIAAAVGVVEGTGSSLVQSARDLAHGDVVGAGENLALAAPRGVIEGAKGAVGEVVHGAQNLWHGLENLI